MLLLSALILRAGSQLFLLVIFSRLGGPTQASTFAVALAITAPFFVTFEMGLRTIYVTAKQPSSFLMYLWSRVAGVVVAAILSSGLAYLLNEPFLIVALVASIKALDSLTDIFVAPLQSAGRIERMAIVITLNAVLSVLSGTWIYAATHSLSLSLIGSLAASLATSMLAGILSVSTLSAQSRLRSALKPVRPHRWLLLSGGAMGLSSGLISLSINIPTYIMNANSTAAAVNVYVMLLYSVMAVELLLNAMVQSRLHTLSAESRLNGDAWLYRAVVARASMISVTSLVVSLPLYPVLATVIPQILGINFWVSPAATMALIITVTILPFAFYIEAFLSIINRYSWQLAVGGIQTLVVVVVGLLTIPRWDLFGATLTVLVGVIVRLSTSTAIAARERRGSGLNVTL